MKRFIVFIIGTLFILILFEGSLRLIGYLGSNRFSKDVSEEAETVMCFGDSYVYGTGVRRGEDYPSLLGDRLKGYQVKNFGEPGANTSRIYQKIVQKISKNKPEIIIVQTGANDNWNRKIYNDGSDKSIKDSIGDILYNIRIFKLIRLLTVKKGLMFREKEDKKTISKEKETKYMFKYEKGEAEQFRKDLNFLKKNLGSEDHTKKMEILRIFFKYIELDCSKDYLFRINVSEKSSDNEEILKKILNDILNSPETIVKENPEYNNNIKYTIYKWVYLNFKTDIKSELVIFYKSMRLFKHHKELYQLFLTRYYQKYKYFISRYNKYLNDIVSINTDDQNNQLILRKVKAQMLTFMGINGKENIQYVLDFLTESIKRNPKEPVFYKNYSEIGYYAFNSGNLKDVKELIQILKNGLIYSYNFDIEKKLAFINRMLFIQTKEKKYLEESIFYFNKILEADNSNNIAFNGMLTDLIWTKDLEELKRFLKDHNRKEEIDYYLTQARRFDPDVLGSKHLKEMFSKKDLDSEFLKYIYSIIDLCKKKKVKLLFLNYPFKDLIEYRYLLNNSNINILDIYTFFKRNIDAGLIMNNEIFLKDRHLSKKGNIYTANLIIERFKQDDWLKDEKK